MNAYAVVDEYESALSGLEWLRERHRQEDEAREAAIASAEAKIREAERRLVALMDHNNLAKIRDGDRVFQVVDGINSPVRSGRPKAIRVVIDPEVPTAWKLKVPDEGLEAEAPEPETVESL